MNLIEELDNFIQATKVAQEQTRAIAAKMAVLRKPSSMQFQLFPPWKSFTELKVGHPLN